MKKERGRFLSLMIGLKILAYLLVLYSAFLLFFALPEIAPEAAKEAVGETTRALENYPSWMKVYSLVDLLAGVAVIWGVLSWKKWAVYLSATLFVLGNFLAFSISGTTGGSGLFPIIVSVLWFWAIFRKWKSFD